MGKDKDLGDELFERGDIDAAIEVYENAILSDPGDIYLYVNLSYVYLTQDMYQKGIGLLENFVASTNQPLVEDIWINLALLKGKISEYEEAQNCFQLAEELNPLRKELYISKSFMFQSMGKIQKAIDTLIIGIERCPKESILYNNLGSLYNDHQDDPESAASYFIQGLKLTPTDPILQNNLGISLVVCGRAAEAVGHFKKAIQAEENYISAYQNLAVAYYNDAKYVQAKEVLSEAIDKFPEHPQKNMFADMLSQLAKND